MSELNNEASSKSKFSPQNLLFFLLVLQFVIAPFYYQPNLGGEGLYLPYNSSVWIVAVWIIAAGAFLISLSRTLVLPRYWLGLACLPIGALITGFIVEAINPTEWLTRLSVITGGYLFFLALFQFRLTSKQVDQSLYIILAFGMIATAYGVFQVHSIGKVYSFIPISIQNSPIGIFQQVNIQTSLMATLLVLAYFLISRPCIKSSSLLIKISICLTAFFSSYLIAASGSRVGLLGAFLGLTILLLGRWSLLTRAKVMMACVLICTVAGAASQTSGLLKTSAKFDRAMGGMEADIRWKVYKISWDLFKESPYTGHGLGSYQKAFQEKRREYQKADTLHLGSAPRFSHPHNEILLWLVEGGIISLSGILIAASATLFQLIKVGWHRATGYAALLVPITLHTQVELPFYTSSTHWLLLLYLLFLTHQHTPKKISTKMLSKTANNLITLSMVGIAIVTNWTLVQAQLANSDIVKYLQSRNTLPQLLKRPIDTFYFRDQALYLYHHYKMVEGVRNGDTQPMLEFINYTESLIQTVPAENYYLALINAYNTIGKTKYRDKLLEEALYTYEASPRLKKLNQKFHDTQVSNSGL